MREAYRHLCSKCGAKLKVWKWWEPLGAYDAPLSTTSVSNVTIIKWIYDAVGAIIARLCTTSTSLAGSEESKLSGLLSDEGSPNPLLAHDWLKSMERIFQADLPRKYVSGRVRRKIWGYGGLIRGIMVDLIINWNRRDPH